MRKLFFWMHLSAGVLAGIVIFIMSVTGVLLMYEKQMMLWFDLRALPPVQGASRLPVETLLTRARDNRGSLPASIALYNDTKIPAQLTFGREILYQDPSNGQILGNGDPRARQFFRTVTDWHRWLATGAESRTTGRAITGSSNLIFLFIVLSGAYLWLPRAWTAASVRAVAWFRSGLSGKARDFNWHNVIGIWSFVPLVLVVASATVISFPWASNLVYALAGSPLPSPPPAPAKQTENGAKGLAGLDDLWRRASNNEESWRVITMRLPASDTAPVTFTIDRGYAGQPQKRTTLTLDRSGAVRTSESYGDMTLGRRIRTWMRFVHTGEFYGLPGQTIAGIASAGASVLAFTGIALSLRRFSAWRGRRARSQVATYPDNCTKM